MAESNFEDHKNIEHASISAFCKRFFTDTKDFYWTISTCANDEYSAYDILAIKYDRNGSRLAMKYVEIKNRNEMYDSFILEKQKWDRLKRELVYFEKISSIYYANFINDKCVIFNLTKMQDSFNWEKRTYNYKTLSPELGKKEKYVTFLKVKDGLTIDLDYRPHLYIKKEDHKKDKGLFDI